MDEDTLTKLLSIREQIPSINTGGCGVFMLALYRYLKKNNKLKGNEKFVYLYGDEEDPDYVSNKTYLKENRFSPTSCCHAVLLQDGELWDCKGEYFTIYKYALTLAPEQYESFVVDSINNRSRWNCAFDRAFAIPIIEEVFDIPT